MIDKGDLEGAKTAAKKAFSADPRNAASLCILGRLSSQGAFVDQADEKFMDSERLFRAALFADPQSSTAAAACAEILDQKGDTEGADELYQRAVQGYPRDPEIQFEYGCFLEEKMKDATLAHVMYDKVLQTNPKHLGCLNNMGNIALMKNDTHTAEEMYRKAMEVAPGDMDLVSNYGLALHKRALQQHANVSKITYDYVKEQALASYLTAEEAMEQALKQNPNDTSVLCNLGFLKAQLRQSDADAEKMFNRALELTPGDASTMSNYALMVMSNGQLRKAEEMLIQALESDPKHASADCNLRFVRRLIDKQRIYQLV
jgi:Tfp pilus assembly protein PilF